MSLKIERVETVFKLTCLLSVLSQEKILLKGRTQTHRNQRYFYGCRFSHNKTRSCKTVQSKEFHELGGKTIHI